MSDAEKEIEVLRLGKALASMYHERGSDQAIMEWHSKQKDFFGGVQTIKKLLWPFASAFGPLEGLYRTHDLRLVAKRVLGKGASISKAQLAVALVEMGFVVLFKGKPDIMSFNTNFPCKRVVERFKNEGVV